MQRLFPFVFALFLLLPPGAAAADAPVCDGGVCRLPQNLARPADLSAVRAANIGAVLPRLDYLAGGRAVFHSYFGLFVYDLDRRMLLRALDLRPIDAVYLQGSVCTRVRVGADGRMVYIDNFGYEADDALYRYDTERDVLLPWPPQSVEDGCFETRAATPPETAPPAAGGEYCGQAADGRLVYFACPDWQARHLQLILYDARTKHAEIHTPLQ